MKLAISFLAFWILNFGQVFAESTQEYFKQGQQFYEQGNFQKAADAFEEAIKISPKSAEIYNALGLTYKSLNVSLPRVAWYFKAAVDIKPDYADAYDNLGKAYYGMGNFSLAEESCLKAVSLNPNLTSSKISLAWIYLMGKKQPTDAIYYFKQVLAKREIPFARYGLGLAYFMGGDSASSLEVITSLRMAGEERLATQLENIVRGFSYVPNNEGPPELPAEELEVKPPSGVPGKASATGNIQIKPGSFTGGTTKVQFKGKITGGGVKIKPAGKNLSTKATSQY